MDKNSANNVDNCDEKYIEENKLACLMSGEYYLGLEKKNVDFYVIKGVAKKF